MSLGCGYPVMLMRSHRRGHTPKQAPTNFAPVKRNGWWVWDVVWCGKSNLVVQCELQFSTGSST
eukprot:4152473-Prymnesium_polylepis.1